MTHKKLLLSLNAQSQNYVMTWKKPTSTVSGNEHMDKYTCIQFFIFKLGLRQDRTQFTIESFSIMKRKTSLLAQITLSVQTANSKFKDFSRSLWKNPHFFKESQPWNKKFWNSKFSRWRTNPAWYTGLLAFLTDLQIPQTWRIKDFLIPMAEFRVLSKEFFSSRNWCPLTRLQISLFESQILQSLEVNSTMWDFIDWVPDFLDLFLDSTNWWS